MCQSYLPHGYTVFIEWEASWHSTEDKTRWFSTWRSDGHATAVEHQQSRGKTCGDVFHSDSMSSKQIVLWFLQIAKAEAMSHNMRAMQRVTFPVAACEAACLSHLLFPATFFVVHLFLKIDDISVIVPLASEHQRDSTSKLPNCRNRFASVS